MNSARKRAGLYAHLRTALQRRRENSVRRPQEQSSANQIRQIDLSSGRATIELTLDEPAMLYLEVTPPQGKGSVAGTAIAPEKLTPAAPRPADFDSFWEAKIKALEAIPANPVLTPGDSGDPNVEYATIKMDHVNSTHVYGHLPSRNAKENSRARSISMGEPALSASEGLDHSSWRRRDTLFLTSSRTMCCRISRSRITTRSRMRSSIMKASATTIATRIIFWRCISRDYRTSITSPAAPIGTARRWSCSARAWAGSRAVCRGAGSESHARDRERTVRMRSQRRRAWAEGRLSVFPQRSESPRDGRVFRRGEFAPRITRGRWWRWDL